MQPSATEIHWRARAGCRDRVSPATDAISGFDDENRQCVPHHKPAGRCNSGRTGPDDGNVDPILHPALPHAPHVPAIGIAISHAIWTEALQRARVATKRSGYMPERATRGTA